MDWIDIEYKLKGLEEGYWRAIGYRDAETIRDCADELFDVLHEVADKIGLEKGL